MSATDPALISVTHPADFRGRDAIHASPTRSNSWKAANNSAAFRGSIPVDAEVRRLNDIRNIEANTAHANGLTNAPDSPGSGAQFWAPGGPEPDTS